MDGAAGGQEVIKRKLVPRWDGKPFGFSAPPRPEPWREKNWCVAELDEEYIAKMEDVLKTYEKPYIAKNLWSAWMSEAVTLHAGCAFVPAGKPEAERRGRDNRVQRCAAQPMYSARWTKAASILPFHRRRTADKFARRRAQWPSTTRKQQTIHLVMD